MSIALFVEGGAGCLHPPARLLSNVSAKSKRRRVPAICDGWNVWRIAPLNRAKTKNCDLSYQKDNISRKRSFPESFTDGSFVDFCYLK